MDKVHLGMWREWVWSCGGSGCGGFTCAVVSWVCVVMSYLWHMTLKIRVYICNIISDYFVY